MQENSKKIIHEKFSLKEVILLILVTAVASLLTGYVITNRILKDKYTSEEVEMSEPLETFIKNYRYIIDNYYGEVDEDKLTEGALSGVLQALGDPYTAFIDEVQANNLNAQLEGSYFGLGVEIYNDLTGLRILSVFQDSPADKSGLIPGDVIIKLNGIDVRSVNSYEFTAEIKNSNAQDYNLTILRDGKEIEVNVKKDIVILKSVAGDVIKKDNKKIGYLFISIFANNTYSQVKQELEKLESQGIDSLIIDVRDNTGGHLTSVENILGLFLDSTHIIYKTEHNGKIESVYSKGNATKSYPIIILTNENSASASEILTVALKEEYGAISVGKKTYGKGSAQELVTLSDGTQYKFTTKKWLSPNGNIIDSNGVSVDIEVDLADAYKNNPTRENDSQLQSAINTIANM